MIWDEHEVVNDFCFDQPKSHLDDITAQIALSVYIEYQDNLQINPAVDTINWVKLYGNTMIITMERTYSEPNLDEIRQNMKVYPEATQFILASAGSILPGPGHKFFPLTFLIELYTMVFDWLNENNQRKALLVGGDLHLGCLGSISNGDRSFYLASASPISNQPTLDHFSLSRQLRLSRQLNEIMIYHPIESRARRCYLQVTTDLEPTMIWADKVITSHPIKYVETLVAFS